MIIIVETNFIVEIVLQQEESSACEEILQSCNGDRPHRLVIPAFCIAEARSALERRQGERREFVKHQVAYHTRDLQRSKPLRRFARIVQQLEAELQHADEDEPLRFVEFIDAVIDRIEMIPLTDSVFRNALLAYYTTGIINRLPDAIVMASVVEYLMSPPPDGQPVYFVTRDTALLKVIGDDLRHFGCRYVRSFTDAAALLRHG